MTEERNRYGKLRDPIVVSGLDRQRAGQTAEAIEDLLAAIEDAKREVNYLGETLPDIRSAMRAVDDILDTLNPLSESLLNDLIEALRDVERGGVEKVEEAKRRNDAKTGWKAMQWGDRSE